MDQCDPGAFVRRLAQPLRKKRMVLAQKAADDKDAVERGELGDRHAEPRRAFALAVGAEVGLPQAKINVLAAQAAHELLREVHLLDRRMRRYQCADSRSAMPFADALELPHDVLECRLPV